ncbi:hypothetical protein C7M84_002050 [Penaeus vannamei]|uniref:Uncharacterized protein n=1 Tax=Penaeus vannamei TaxID=6689 RepID=A0A3R7MDW7_PENVA|nr:hypothetical protein C7M84_002050 [Penaeus vannamei]
MLRLPVPRRLRTLKNDAIPTIRVPKLKEESRLSAESPSHEKIDSKSKEFVHQDSDGFDESNDETPFEFIEVKDGKFPPLLLLPFFFFPYFPFHSPFPLGLFLSFIPLLFLALPPSPFFLSSPLSPQTSPRFSLPLHPLTFSPFLPLSSIPLLFRPLIPSHLSPHQSHSLLLPSPSAPLSPHVSPHPWPLPTPPSTGAADEVVNLCAAIVAFSFFAPLTSLKLCTPRILSNLLSPSPPPSFRSAFQLHPKLASAPPILLCSLQLTRSPFKLQHRPTTPHLLSPQLHQTSLPPSLHPTLAPTFAHVTHTSPLDIDLRLLIHGGTLSPAKCHVGW